MYLIVLDLLMSRFIYCNFMGFLFLIFVCFCVYNFHLRLLGRFDAMSSANHDW